jgi:hypothetical protein
MDDLKTLPIAERGSKVHLDHLAPVPTPLHGFLDRLPNLLVADQLRSVVAGIVAARRAGRPVLLTMGAHVVKCGLAPVLIELARKGIVTAFATNGASLVHDSELALFGETSEDVEVGLREGTFGMAEETHTFINGAVRDGVRRGEGLGEAVGRALLAAKAPHAEVSLLAQCAALGIPLSVHVAIGTDILHMHPTADGAAIGEGSLRDFHRLYDTVAQLAGGAVLNVGSAVILPEVLLKTFSMLRNRGGSLDGCACADFDMVRNYRTTTQVVNRVKILGGQGHAITGHHEIMLPLLAGLLLAELPGSERTP